jgi:hypothetical protein
MPRSKRDKVVRGGRRPGAGRRPKPPEELMKCISFALPPATIVSIDSEAGARGVNRSKYLRFVIAEGMKAARQQWKPTGSVGSRKGTESAARRNEGTRSNP